MYQHDLTIRGISVFYGRTRVLDSTDLTARPGRVYGLLGLNGAGKSTLLNAVLGLVDYEGDILIGGKPWTPNSLRAIGASVNGPSYYPHLSATRNLLVHARLTGTDPARIPEVLSIVGLASGTKRARRFSTGMKVRLSLAMALLTDPPILLLDEPQNGLDPQGISDLRRLIDELAARGKTIVISSHQLGEVEKMVDDIGILTAGRISFEGPLDQLAGQGESLEQAFFRIVEGGAA